MNLKKFYRNPEAKRITVKFIMILLVGIIGVFIFSFGIVKKINKTLVSQNTVILANVLEERNTSEIIKNFYDLKSDTEIEEAKKLLESYGYDENLSLASNEINIIFFKEVVKIFLPMIIIFISILYLFFLRELKRIYIQIEEIVLKTSAMSKGEYKRIESAFEEGEMSILITSLNYMGDRVNNSIRLLKEEKEYLKDFLSDISHQLKTPLASLIMFNDLLKENPNMLDEDRVKFIEGSEEQLGRMDWLIMNLLKVGRLEAGVIKFEEDSQSLRDTIELSVSSLREKAISKKQELVVKGALDTVLKHDKEWLAEAISNILKNAIEHTQEEGKIQVEISRGPLITKIYIKDNGPGIPLEMQKKIFKRFYKGTSKRNPKSIGIGLSLSKSIVEEQGGEIKLLSEEGKGSTFIISFMDSLKD